jgi:DNA-binding MarR family transcriptional regulator
MKPVLPDNHLEAWRRCYVFFWRISSLIEADLLAAGLPSLSWYDALYQLYLAPDRRLPMSKLAHGALLSRSGLTRLVDKLEKERLIERVDCAADGRVQYAVLTEQGIGTLRAIWKVYRAAIAKYFAADLGETEAKQLVSIFTRLGAPLEPKL